MEKSIGILKKSKIRATPQRVAVMSVLAHTESHFTVEEVHCRVKKDIPTISLATVYSILESLVAAGLIQQLRIDFTHSCFERTKNIHHHFLCRTCKRIFDIHIPLCPTASRREVDGHSIEQLQGYFYGTCRVCLESTKR